MIKTLFTRLVDAIKKIKNKGFIVGVIVGMSVILVALFMIGVQYSAALYYHTWTRVGSFNALQNALRLDPKSDLYQRDMSQAIITVADQVLAGAQTQQEFNTQLQVAASAAIDAAMRATQNNSSDARNWANRGSVYSFFISLVGGADTAAQDSYEKAISRDPQNPQYYLDRANTFIRSADLNAAQERVSAQKENLDQAQKDIEKAIALKPDYQPALLGRMRLALKNKDTDLAENTARSIMAYYPQDMQAAINITLVYAKAGYSEKALALAQDIVRIAPSYVDGRYVLGLLYNARGDRTRALSQFEELEKMDLKNAHIILITENLRAGKDALDGGIVSVFGDIPRLEPIVEKKK